MPTITSPFHAAVFLTAILLLLSAGAASAKAPARCLTESGDVSLAFWPNDYWVAADQSEDMRRSRVLLDNVLGITDTTGSMGGTVNAFWDPILPAGVRLRMALELSFEEPADAVSVSGRAQGRIQSLGDDDIAWDWRGRVAGSGFCTDVTCEEIGLTLDMAGRLNGDGSVPNGTMELRGIEVVYTPASGEWTFVAQDSGFHSTDVILGIQARECRNGTAGDP